MRLDVVQKKYSRYFKSITRKISSIQQEKIKKKVISILNEIKKPQEYDSDLLFKILQDKYAPFQGYGYDSFSTWCRGISRAQFLLEKFNDLHTPGLSILEAGCGDGMTAVAFASYGHKAFLVDYEDWRDPRALFLPFECDNLCKKLSFDSSYFDLVYSYNTFEHLNNPKKALDELIRVCRPGGYIYLEFGPLYASPWGLHAYRTLRMPYPQFLFSQRFIDKKLEELGIVDLGKSRTSLQPLNRWKVLQFEELFKHPSCSIITNNCYTDISHLEMIIEYGKAFSGRGLTFEDVTTNVISVGFKKKFIHINK